ncbi:MAG: hypothetical protein PHG66_05875 [Candidatus Colwellbacteria bacterium]|nr:hypothetical protein [Candidatus Colwellbacteria bacterium]
MNIFDEKRPLKINNPIGGERPIAFLIDSPFKKKGIYYFDIGYPEATLNPLHFVPGEISGEGPWQIGDSIISVMKKDDPLMAEYSEWLDYKKEELITDESTHELFNILIEEMANDY